MWLPSRAHCVFAVSGLSHMIQIIHFMKIPWVSSWYDSCCSSFLLFPFLSPVDKVIYFCQTWQNGVQWNRQVTLLLEHLCWLFNQDWKAPTPAGCSSILILPSPNQDKTPRLNKTTQVVVMPRILQCLSSASHIREQECRFKNIFFLLSSCWSFKAVSCCLCFHAVWCLCF